MVPLALRGKISMPVVPNHPDIYAREVPGKKNPEMGSIQHFIVQEIRIMNEVNVCAFE
jgi:hypothetical protein